MAVTDKHVKIAAIAALAALEIVNLLTARYDSNVLLSLGALIGGLAGYGFGRYKSAREKR